MSYTKNRHERSRLPALAWGRRLPKIKVVFALCLTTYSIFIVTYNFRTTRNRDLKLGKISKSCWLSDSSGINAYDAGKYNVVARKDEKSSKESNTMNKSDDEAKTGGGKFRILCTSTRKKMNWGSYQLRCRDLKTFAQRCAKNVHIQTDVSFEKMQRLRWLRYAMGQLLEGEGVEYNATIFVKSFPGKRNFLPLYGNMFVDLVDEYGYGDEDIPEEMQLILQTDWQGSQVFPSHNYTVVEHWYNSFPADMVLSGLPERIPPISEQTADIRIATVWNTKREKVPSEGGCPKVHVSNVTYDCLDKPFDISTWYLNLFNGEKDRCEMERILDNPLLGTGMLYYNVFRNFDALVVLAKNDTMKLEYGNVQRAVSQMRSGVPVLIEIRGRVLEDFVRHYNYTCAFQRYFDRTTSKRYGRQNHRFKSFDEAIAMLKRPEIRRQCQKEGLAIVEDYSPSRIAKKFLRAIGYFGDFQC